MTRIKICGLTRIEDVDAAVSAGADAIGFVFYKESKRYVTLETAKALIRRVPPFVLSVGLFVNETQEVIERILDELPLSLLQFHGDETPADCEKYHRPYIKAVRMNAQTNLLEISRQFECAKGLLLDADSASFGGTGNLFDWSMIPDTLEKPIILAGGLRPDNVAIAISQVKPYAVDVSSGVESQPGIKCHHKVKAFIQQIRYQ